ncbi:glycosyl transferase group 1 [Thermodesulfatator indicus DSM 15286]|uniref:Glycosyl transferase group 1 n=1 Tax=Thermodesulfatator indicus (strain DSM 15286 / JCM 11887 / CIR29812) TaxID=667014 RepID=F8ABK9_THEID|nr:glycosyltransferase family 4 protein [Thermodesulfatator indicus]AEH45608.1 glycosyl transferase group 1 [Thermodesulfatator indicus DSM 15286]
MKILLTSLAPFIGGAEVALERLALGLQASGHKVTCALGSNNEVGRRFSEQGVNWVHFPMPFTEKLNLPYYWWAVWRFRRYLKREGFDLVHANDLPSFQFLSAAAKPFRTPRICHHRYIFGSDAIKWLLKFGVEYHVFVSNALRKDLEKAYPPLASQPGEVVYDGLPLPELPNENERLELRQKLNLPGDKVIVLFAGQIIPRKGVQDLIRAWKLLPDKVKQKAHLVIIGDDLAGQGAYRQEMEDLAKELRVKADFRGFQKNVDEWLDAVDIVTVPSHIEPLGNATLEAMAHARPVIGGAVGGIPEMIVDGETGLLVPPKKPEALAEALRSLIVDPLLVKDMGEAARRRCEVVFSLDRHVENMLRVYETVLGL